MCHRNVAEQVHLRLWEEIVGTCRSIDRNEYDISVTIDGLKIIFPRDSSEAKMLEKITDYGFLGQKVGILRTDLPRKPLLLRLVKI